MRLRSISWIGLLVIGTLAHKEIPPGLVKRHADLSKRCASGVAHLKKRRYERRNTDRHERRNTDRLEPRFKNTTYEIVTEAPYYDVLQNDTCVLVPDVTVGPYYWPRSQVLRQDITENQVGTPLILDVGVLDMATCEPLPNALVSFWHCNGTGSYSSFTGHDPNLSSAELLKSMNLTQIELGKTDLHTDNTTWLRGMWPTNDEGLLEMKTIFPGFYAQRSIHIHAQVYTEWVIGRNGTIKTGETNSVGQIYFDESVSQKIMALEPYASHTEIERTTNDADSLFHHSFVNGYDPVIDIVPLDGKDIRNGMIGYITIGIDTEHLAPVGGNLTGLP
ncbi:protocatechuate 3 [Fusarium bulbicola]|nr:protocatechuate 3 [Fusarium bulbicola]